MNEGKHAGIILLSLWDDVQEHIRLYGSNRNGNRKHRKHVFLLVGLVECGWCGALMTPKYTFGRNKQRYFYYQYTTTDHRCKDGCTMKAAPAEPLEDIISQRIRKISQDENLLNGIIENANKSSRVEEDIIKRKQNILKKG